MGSKSTSPKKVGREITLQELALHNTSKDAWIAINGKVYDVTDYIPRHPGGKTTIMQGIGRDATNMFNQAHDYVDPGMNLPKDKLIGTLKR